MNRTDRRKAARTKRPPTEDQLVGVLRSDAPGEAKQAARVWLRFPATRADHFAERATALARRRARNRVARASRKLNRG